MTPSVSAFELGQRVHAELVGHPAFEMTAPDDEAEAVIVYLTYDDRDLRRELQRRHGERVIVEVVDRDGGWRAF